MSGRPKWMVRLSRSYKSTLRAFGWDVMRVKDDTGVYWCASVDLWWVGIRAEYRA